MAASPDPAAERAMAAWYSAAGSISELLSPEMRYRTPWGGGELGEAVQNARRWLADHPCPDHTIGRHLAAMLDAYAEMPRATVRRVMELREIIGEHALAVSERALPGPASSSAGR